MTQRIITIVSKEGRILGHAFPDAVPGYEAVYNISHGRRIVNVSQLASMAMNNSADCIRFTALLAIQSEFRRHLNEFYIRYMVMQDETATWLWDNPGFFRFNEQILR